MTEEHYNYQTKREDVYEISGRIKSNKRKEPKQGWSSF